MAKKTDSKAQRPLKTLERVLSKSGIGSRTDARGWIHGGKVRVNGQVVQNPDQWVDLERDRIFFTGQPLRSAKKIYILLYKPKGYITSHGDPQGRPTVYDLIADVDTWLSPVGRLDLETSGLLLLTNDNDFAERIMNPEHKVPKTYRVKTSTLLTGEQMERLRQGVELSDGMTRSAGVVALREGAKCSFLEITITEGRNRQVRRMMEAIGSKVLKLVRVAIGPILIGDLPIGQWRHLTAQETRALRGSRLPESGNRDG